MGSTGRKSLAEKDARGYYPTTLDDANACKLYCLIFTDIHKKTKKTIGNPSTSGPTTFASGCFDWLD